MGKHKKKSHNRIEGVEREPSGRVSRSKAARAVKKKLIDDRVAEEEREMLAPMMEARMRVHGVKAHQARDQLAGSFVGRLAIIGTGAGGISRAQADAAATWLQSRADYLIAIQSPRDATAMDLAKVSGLVHGENVKRTRTRVESHEAAIRAIREAQQSLGLKSNLWAALNLIVEQDKEVWNLVGDLRQVLNVLAKHYQLDRTRAA